jgi:hypothetical protein
MHYGLPMRLTLLRLRISKELIEAAVADVLAYLGMGDGVEVEVVHLTEEQTDKLKASGMLDEYLMGRDKEDCDG